MQLAQFGDNGYELFLAFNLYNRPGDAAHLSLLSCGNLPLPVSFLTVSSKRSWFRSLLKRPTPSRGSAF